MPGVLSYPKKLQSYVGGYYEIYSSNSFCSADSVNSLKWNDLNQAEYQNVYRYYQGLIAFRKAHPALRMVSAEEVGSHIVNLTGLDFNVTGFRILPGANGEENEFVMIFNPRSEATTVALPEGKWEIFVNDKEAGLKVLDCAEGEAAVAPISAMVLVKQVQKDSTNNLLPPRRNCAGTGGSTGFAEESPQEIKQSRIPESRHTGYLFIR